MWQKANSAAFIVFVVFAAIFMALDATHIGTSLPSHPKLLIYVLGSALIVFLIVVLVVYAAVLLALWARRRFQSYGHAFGKSLYFSAPILALGLFGIWYGGQG